ncbi:MAG TPA: hypothetical protein VIK18_13270 [Pirellulales bacterium]
MDGKPNPYEPPLATASRRWWARASRKEILLSRLPGICLFVALAVIRGIGRGIHDKGIPGSESRSSKLAAAALLLMLAAGLFFKNRTAGRSATNGEG